MYSASYVLRTIHSAYPENWCTYCKVTYPARQFTEDGLCRPSRLQKPETFFVVVAVVND